MLNIIVYIVLLQIVSDFKDFFIQEEVQLFKSLICGRKKNYIAVTIAKSHPLLMQHHSIKPLSNVWFCEKISLALSGFHRTSVV